MGDLADPVDDERKGRPLNNPRPRVACPTPEGAKKGRWDCTAERRKRSKAGRAARSRSASKDP